MGLNLLRHKKSIAFEQNIKMPPQ